MTRPPPPPPARWPAARSLFRAALRLLPHRLRDKHGPAMEALFAVSLTRALDRGRMAALRTVAASLGDVVRRALYERVRPSPLRSRPHPPTRASAMDSITQDIRHALRSLRGAPGFTASAILILALAVGANTAIFSVVKGVILEPLPFPAADRVVHLGMDYGGGPSPAMPLYRYHWLQERATAFQATAVWQGVATRTEVEGRPRGVSGIRVGDGFFETVGWSPAMGRGFSPAELEPDGPRAVVVSAPFARDRFGPGSEALGRTLRLGGEAHAVVGVLPEAFAFPQRPGAVQVVLPLRVRPDPLDEGSNYQALGRLAPGVERREAQAELEVAWAAFRQVHGDLVGDPERGPVLAGFDELYVGSLGTALWLVMGAVGLVLLIGCANVANLLLARAVGRRREMGLRVALGASRLRVLRLLATESLLLTGAAGLLGVGVGWLSLEVLLAMVPAELPRVDQVGVDLPVLGAAVAATVVTGLAFGLVMALPGRRTSPGRALREGGRGYTGPGRARSGLVLLQSSLAMVLLVGAGLLLGTLAELRRVDPGFEAPGLVAVSFPVRPEGYRTGAELTELHRRVRDRVVAGGLTGVAAAFNLPLERGLNFPVAIAGRPDDFEGAVEIRGVSPDYFELLGIDILRGRAFDEADAPGAPPAVVVSEAFADRWFPDGDALGRRVELGRFRGRYILPALEGHSAEIVGVVRDVRDRSLRQPPRRTLYLPLAQTPAPMVGGPVFLARAGGPVRPEAVRITRAAVEEVDASLPRPEVRPLERVVAASLARERFNATLLGAFAGLAVLLTAFGVFGVVAYDVRRRQREIGVRMALGARPRQVLALVTARGMGPVLAGLALGAAAALGLSRLVQSLVWGVSPSDPAIFAAVAALLVAVTAVAGWIPARRAARVDPVRSLGAE